MVNDLKLVNRFEQIDVSNQTTFNSSADIDIDDQGWFKRCDGYEGLEQALLKAIFTETQLSGYGTDIYSLLGKKNMSYVKGKLLSEVVSTISIISGNQMKFYDKVQTFDKRSIISSLKSITGYSVDKESLDIFCSIISYYDRCNSQAAQDMKFTINNQ